MSKAVKRVSGATFSNSEQALSDQKFNMAEGLNLLDLFDTDNGTNVYLSKKEMMRLLENHNAPALLKREILYNLNKIEGNSDVPLLTENLPELLDKELKSLEQLDGERAGNDVEK